MLIYESYLEYLKLFAPMMSSDNYGTSSGLVTRLNHVHIGKAFALVCRFQLFCEHVVADTASIYNGIWRQDILFHNDE